MTKAEAREVGLSVGPSWITYTRRDHREGQYFTGLFSLTITPAQPDVSTNARKIVFYHDAGTVPLTDLPMHTTFNVLIVAHMVNGLNVNATVLCTTVKTCEFRLSCYSYFDDI